MKFPENDFVKISPNKLDPGKKYSELNKQLKAGLLDKNINKGLFSGFLNHEFIEWSYDHILK